MPRYVAAPRLAASPPGEQTARRPADIRLTPDGNFDGLLVSSFHAIRSAFVADADILGEPPDAEEMVIECDERTAAAKQQELPDNVIFEPEKYRWHGLTHPAFSVLPGTGQAVPAGVGAAVELSVGMGGAPLEGAVRGDKIGKVSPEWVEQLRQVPGVEVHEADADQARISSDESGIRRLRSALSSDYLIEEEMRRNISP
ncbi:hypothetical protein [Bradyrhizobium sp. 188]|uniref:hypothetical protein n=1 Tax=Bradyrhizobium sp. 188 TaxID=2782656 RepID=UPI001FF9CB2E|nr:hypothetical protein [Bradyrhizobium sp. 188]MCK1502130.1 hypothetical protein [Bradyrhizobium sp. 188]